MLTLEQVDNVIREIFDDSKVKTIDNVYEKSGDYYRLVFSFHDLKFDDVSVIHTKLIFPANLEKTGLINNSFVYLKDINCKYVNRTFEEDSVSDLKDVILEIFNSNDFGDDLKNLSKFNDYPANIIDNQLQNKNIDNFSVFNVIYEPKFRITPCKNISFDFDININNSHNVHFSVNKENIDVDDEDSYNLYFKLVDIITIKINNLNNLGEIVAEQLIKIMDKLI